MAPRSIGSVELGSDMNVANNNLDTEEKAQVEVVKTDSSSTAAVVIGDASTPPATQSKTDDPLHPDPGTEHLYHTKGSKFAFSPGQLSKLLNPKSHAALYALGGLSGLETGLQTNRLSGLSLDETTLDGAVSFEQATGKPVTGNTSSTLAASLAPNSQQTEDGAFGHRKRIFGDNRLPEKKSKSFLEIAWITYNDKVLILLTAAAVISLALGLYQTLGQPHPDGQASVEWVEGVAITVAILIVVIVGTINDWQKERQFVKLNKKNDDRNVKVIRSGKSFEIPVFDVLVGDVMHLEPGDLIPVDGVFIQGHAVKCDESSATGESDLLKKQPADEVFRAMQNGAPGRLDKLDCFIISGSKVAEGTGTFLVTATGIHSTHGRTTMALREDQEATPLQKKLNTLADYIAKVGGGAALVLFFVLFIKFCAQLRYSTESPSQKGQNFLHIFIVAVTVVVVAVPEGLPLAVTLALAFATTRMLKDNNLVRVLRACETMGNATTICSDKTGTLTQNRMSVVAGTISKRKTFGGLPATNSEDNIDQTDPEKTTTPVSLTETSIAGVVSTLGSGIKALLVQGITVNSTAFEGEVDGLQTFIGSKTETALLEFARDRLGSGPLQQERASAHVVQVVPFDSAAKYMATIVKLSENKYRAYVKGASEILLARCTKVVEDTGDPILVSNLTDDAREELSQAITSYASQTLRTIAISYRDFASWPPNNAVAEDDAALANFPAVHEEMTLLAIVGIKDPLRPGVPEAVLDCQKAGVFVRMVTGDNILTAKAIATECGIYTPATGGVIMEGSEFRRLSPEDMEHTVPKLQVLARSSPEDKRLLVQTLKSLGETVAVTGDGTNDAPALKTADIGFSMGIAGTEVAKEASSIVLMDDNFSSIVKAIMWGRAVNDAVKKFLQFQLTVNITAVVLTFVSAVASDREESVLTAVQLLWVNLIMDTLAALALATDPPSRQILDRKPDRKSAPLITVTMAKMIIGQAIFQLVITLTLNFAGASILGYETEDQLAQLSTLVFNTFVWMQIFNQYNNRRLDNRFNVFEGVQRNVFFIVINVIMIGGQVLIIYIGGRAFNVTRLHGTEWAISLVLGALSLPFAVLVRLFPDAWVIAMIPFALRKWWVPDSIDVETQAQRASARPESLGFIRHIRGGRVNHLHLRQRFEKYAETSGLADRITLTAISGVGYGR
ncbi:calcium-translocating P-type ATPase [Bombardia bombarda]|uniref:Calcium-transporting ATPase n=1 Tax=Bombardia bombarda TaxID=252184 RepID=A0AA39WHW0_9PEZI|nr:calcium-translocating P-type ATPase [Bombardia bombarda]